MTNKRFSTIMAVLAIVTLNIACWWFFTQKTTTTACPAAEDDDATSCIMNADLDEPLQEFASITAKSALQSNLLPNRIASITIDFNFPLDRASITPETLQLFENDRSLNWTVEPRGAKSICITTSEPVNANFVTVKLLKGIASYQKDVLSSTAEKVFTVPLTNDFGINRFSVQTPPFGDPIITIGFTKPPDVSKASEFIVCEPPVSLNVADEDGWGYYWSRNLKVSGKFEIGRHYTLSFREGMPSSQGFSLESTLTREFTVPNRAADIRFAVTGRYLPPDGTLAVPIKVVNTTNVNVSVSTVPPQNIVQLMAREAGIYRNRWSETIEDAETLELTAPPKTGRIAIHAPANTERREIVKLSDYMDGKRRGVMLVQVDCTDRYTGNEISDTRLICVSDLGISARLAKDTAHVWVTSLRSGTPVAWTTVRIYAKNNTLIAQGTSDESGIARIPLPSTGSEPFVVVAETDGGSDMAFIPISNATSVDENNGAQGVYADAGACKAFVYTDRGIYRHNEPIHLQALLRNEKIEAPSPFPVKLDVIRPDGRSFITATVMPDETGCITPEKPITIPDNQPSGTWTFKLSIPGEKGLVLGLRTVSIESFVPPQIRVSFTSLPEDALFDKPLPFIVHAEHLFGKAAADLKAEAAVSYAAAKFEPEGWATYTFGNSERSLKGNHTVIGKGFFDADGNAQFTLPFDSDLMPAAMLAATLEGTAFEPGGRPVSMRTSVKLHRYPHYIGIKAPESNSLAVSTTNVISIAIVDREGARLADSRPLAIQLFRLSRIYGYTSGANGQWVWKNEVIKSAISSTSVASATDVDIDYPFSVGTSGEYLLVVTDPTTNTSTSYSFMATQDAGSTTRSNLSNPAKVELTFDKPSYLAGEIAKLKITTPFTGTAMFSLQRESVLKSEVIDMTNTTLVVEIPVTDDFYPNIQASVSIIRPAEAEETWSAHRASGLSSLIVARPEDKLNVSNKAAVNIIAGGSEVKVSIHLDPTETSTSTFATVFVTDEAIQMLTSEKLPDPYRFFSMPCASATTLNDLFSLLMPITADTVSANAAKIGGDGEAPLMRRISPVASRRFKPLSLAAYTIPLIEGHAEHTFKLPEFAGEVRVSVVTWNKTASGSTSTNVKVSPKLVARPDAPRFLACGDSTQLTYSVHNQSGADCNATYSLTFAGSIVGDASVKTIDLKAGESRILKIAAQATEDIGQGRVTFQIEGAGEKHEETLEIPIRPAMPLVTQVECFPLEEGQHLALPIPANLIPSTVAQSLRCHNSSFAEFAPALSFLLDYPYGCLEQTTSSAFPLIHAGGALFKIAASDDAAIQETMNKVRVAVQRVNAQQTRRGYSLWHDVSQYDDMISVYACHFLAEAVAAGITDVQKSTLEGNAVFLQVTASRALANGNHTLSAYCCHVLALSHAPEKSTMFALYDVRSRLSAEGKAHLARAFALSGDRVRALELMESTETPSSIAAASFGILAWLELDTPDADRQIASLYAYLLERKAALNKPHWGTTRDNALSLLAIGALAQRKADPEATLNVVLTKAEDERLATITNRTATVQADSATVTALNSGRGTAYLVRTLSGVPSKLDASEKSNGITISRSYRNLAGELVDLASLTPGDAVVVELSIRVRADTEGLDDAIVEELLPACLEPDTGSLAASGTLSWLSEDEEKSILRREVRDDRLLFFMNPIDNTISIHYSARVVSSGTFTIPPASVEGMYRPDVNARTAPTTVVIEEVASR